MDEPLRGSCLCGGVKYELRGQPMGMYHCHCGTCRKANGASNATNVFFPRAAFTIVEGEALLSKYESSPDKHRYFCSRCGSPVYSHAQKTAGMVSIRAGLLDGDPGVRPQAHVFVASKAPWTTIADGLPTRDAM